MNVLSLFSGIGGLDLGLQRAGMTITGQVEIDPWCRNVLAKHWPEVPRHDDVRTAARWWGGRRAPDVVCGGFPCQPVSLAGRGLAQADERWLWPAFADVIRALRPRFVLVENVPGLLGRGMGDVLGDLASLGYDAEWDCISAADVGAPHLRKRIWIVAYPDRGRLAEQPECNGEPVARIEPSLRRDPLGLRDDVADTAGARHAQDARSVYEDALAHRPQLSQLASRRGADVADADRAGLAQRESQPGDDGAELAPAQRGSHGARDLADASRIGRREGPRVFRGMGPAERGWWRTEPDVGRVAHGIPQRVDRLRGLGNAVVPQVAEHIGRMIMDAAA